MAFVQQVFAKQVMNEPFSAYVFILK